MLIFSYQYNLVYDLGFALALKNKLELETEFFILPKVKETKT